MSDKKARCEPCEFFAYYDGAPYFGYYCRIKRKQIGEMFMDLCGEGNCSYFKKKESCVPIAGITGKEVKE